MESSVPLSDSFRRQGRISRSRLSVSLSVSILLFWTGISVRFFYFGRRLGFHQGGSLFVDPQQRSDAESRQLIGISGVLLAAAGLVLSCLACHRCRDDFLADCRGGSGDRLSADLCSDQASAYLSAIESSRLNRGVVAAARAFSAGWSLDVIHNKRFFVTLFLISSIRPSRARLCCQKVFLNSEARLTRFSST